MGVPNHFDIRQGELIPFKLFLSKHFAGKQIQDTYADLEVPFYKSPTTVKHFSVDLVPLMRKTKEAITKFTATVENKIFHPTEIFFHSITAMSSSAHLTLATIKEITYVFCRPAC